MKPLLHIHSLTKNYGATTALDSIELFIEPGSALAVLGPNGAGKSTLFGCLLGFTLASAGEIFFEDRPLRASDRLDFGYAAERVAIYPQRTVLENVAFFAELKGVSVAEAETQLARVGLDTVRNRKERQLSKGMLQRLGLAIALCGRPRVLVLDEPFNGLDPALLGTFQRVLREELTRGATLLVSTHTMSAIEPLATNVAVLLAGRLADAGTVDALRNKHAEHNSLEALYHRIATSVTVSEDVYA